MVLKRPRIPVEPRDILPFEYDPRGGVDEVELFPGTWKKDARPRRTLVRWHYRKAGHIEIAHDVLSARKTFALPPAFAGAPEAPALCDSGPGPPMSRLTSHRLCRYVSSIKMRPPVQQSLPFRTWGGRRSGAGRKPVGRTAGVPHRRRPNHSRHHPAHVTLRVVRGLGSLRTAPLWGAVERSLARASRRGFRVVHFSVQRDHVHLVVEAANREVLMRQAKGLSVRLAHAVNRTLGRRGKVFADRYHARALTTPREVRHALVYVLRNWRRPGVDPCSSGPWFSGWRGAGHSAPRTTRLATGKGRDAAAAATWLLAVGWRRHGLIDVHEMPADGPHRTLAGSGGRRLTGRQVERICNPTGEAEST